MNRGMKEQTKEENNILSDVSTVLAEDQTHEISWVAVVGKMTDTVQKLDWSAGYLPLKMSHHTAALGKNDSLKY